MGTAHTSAGVRGLVKSVVGGLRAWQQPEASTEGLGGTYFFLDENGKKTAIVKPCDEEPMAPNNPKVPQIFPLFSVGAAIPTVSISQSNPFFQAENLQCASRAWLLPVDLFAHSHRCHSWHLGFCRGLLGELWESLD